MSNPTQYLDRLKEAAAFLENRFGEAPPAALVLGSGLGDFVDGLPGMETLPYREIPHFPVSAVVGHAGKLSVGEYEGRKFCALQGRVHYYEGHTPGEITFSVRAVALWGARDFVITNAAGGIRSDLKPGDLLLLGDHINLMGINPLHGPPLDALGEPFPDLSEAYDRALLQLARRCGKELGLDLKEGVYVALAGPSYETPAEIRMCRTLGADAVGMSTVPEVIALNHMGRRVLAISCISNMAAGVLPQKLRHQEVLETATRVRRVFSQLILKIIASLEP